MTIGDLTGHSYTEHERRENDLMEVASKACDTISVSYDPWVPGHESTPWVIWSPELAVDDVAHGATFLDALTAWCLSERRVPREILPGWFRSAHPEGIS